jgi:hypothetical protein
LNDFFNYFFLLPSIGLAPLTSHHKIWSFGMASNVVHMPWNPCVHKTPHITVTTTTLLPPPLSSKKTSLKWHFDATSHHTNLPSLQTQLIPIDPIPLGFILSNNKD